MDRQESRPKWEATVSARLTKARVDQIWPLLKDFHQWFPTLATCYGVRGANGEPGCIRYCSGSSIPSKGDHKAVSWVVPGGDVEGQYGCLIEWSITVDPVEGWGLDDLVKKYELCLQSMEDAVL
ncbi:hypothetical protein L3X38_007505 [Prunus dulcis]|uniref:Polyketide cyclase/dehydrase and lipid transport superfamily protein n=1 Tax=Prunus dulcis TaxID=3755 RepID=A0AAD4ZUN6_PRUDU|nr:hypothetical protein L3X38_007505 [Prunus dulcis]